MNVTPQLDPQILELMRQSFAPLNTLGSGQLALAQAQQERDYTARVQQANYERQLNGQFQLLGQQNDYSQQRQAQSEEAARTLEALRAQSSFNNAVGAAGANASSQRKTAESLRALDRSNALRSQAIDHGLDPSKMNDAQLESALAGKTKENQTAADRYVAQLDGLSKKAEDLDTAMRLPEAQKLAIAKQVLASNWAVDDKKKLATVAGLKSYDDAVTLLDDSTGREVDSRIAVAEKPLTIRHATKARQLGSQIQTVQRSLDVLARRGVFPNPPTPTDDESTAPGGTAADMGLPDPAIFSKPAPGPTQGAPTSTNYLVPAAGAAATVMAHPAARAAAMNAIRGLMTRGGAAAMGAGRFLPTVGPGMLAYSAGSYADDLSGGRITDTLANNWSGGSVPDEAARQHSFVNTLRALISRSTPQQAAQLRALSYGPTADRDGIDAIMGIQRTPEPVFTSY